MSVIERRHFYLALNVKTKRTLLENATTIVYGMLRREMVLSEEALKRLRWSYVNIIPIRFEWND
jgi:hypothetical protein